MEHVTGQRPDQECVQGQAGFCGEHAEGVEELGTDGCHRSNGSAGRLQQQLGEPLTVRFRDRGIEQFLGLVDDDQQLAGWCGIGE
jgi:hypothetical protein